MFITALMKWISEVWLRMSSGGENPKPPSPQKRWSLLKCQIGSVVHFVPKMSQGAVLYLLCALGLFQKGLAALIETQQTVLAAVGEEAQLNCQLMQHEVVPKVTWWKILPDWEEKNLASYIKDFGQEVNPDFIDKMKVICEAGLLNCSLVIKNMTEQDEGCYHCVFNTESLDAFNGTTCLRVYAHVSSGPQIEVSTIIPADKRLSAADFTFIIILSVTVGCVCVAAIIIFLLIRKHHNRSSHSDSEETETTQNPTSDTHESSHV